LLIGAEAANSQPTRGKDADEYLHTTSEHYLELLKAAPLWLDWQIQQIADRDLKQANQFQQVSQQMVKLLKLIDNPNTRNYYIRCAELLSQGKIDLYRSV